MYNYYDDPFAELRQSIDMGEQFVDSCGSYLSAEQKEAISRNLYRTIEIERVLRNARTPRADELADRCNSLQRRMRSLL